MWNEILAEIVQKGKESGTFPAPTSTMLQQVWPALAGSSIARLSSPVRLEQGTLYLTARDASLVEDWRSSPLPLLKRLRRFSPWPIDNLHVEFDPCAGSEHKKKTASSPPPSGKEDDRSLQEIIEGIEALRSDGER